MSNHRKEDKLKASTAELVGPLLKRLELAKKQAPTNPEREKFIDQISAEVEEKKNVLDSIGKWDRDLIGYFGKIERNIDYWIDHNYEMTECNKPTVTNLMEILNQSSQHPRANPPKVSTKSRGKAPDLPPEATIIEVGESSNRSHQENELSMVKKAINSVGTKGLCCLYSLANFPEHTILKRRILIYLWIGLGLVSSFENTNRTAEQLGEIFFSRLVKKGVIIPVHTREHNQVIDCCTIKPTIHKQLISACKREQNLMSGICELYDGFNVKGLLNLGEPYLKSTDISGKDDTLLIQLGRWRHIETAAHNGDEENGSEETTLEDHIEVDETDFLKKLGEKVTYLSLRGISRIEEIPESIGKLQHLLILDLRACHNLEKLPQKTMSTLKPKLTRWTSTRESWWFDKLIVLDISECYLLDHMPKWLCELRNLEVLKGFVVSGVRNKTQSCRVSDLSELKKLRKLSIRISSEHLDKEDFSGLKDLDRLLILTIIWRDNKNNSSLSQNNKPNDTIPTYSFPKNLEKLDMRCYPEAEASNLLNPTKLTNLKRLYIRGGKLIKIPYNDKWKVEILRLRFLKNLKTDWVELMGSFENLKYVEYVESPEPENFPKNGDGWIIQKSVTIHEGESVFCYQYRADTPVDITIPSRMLA
ncbi:disease resistance RPP13-like protein 4 [Carex littledalei]|uniref:Disease resistance RPP13-like protein 4 n=1 Tax=Carex littledalei TaxID=544730 RepID=A0A833VFW3_9POAL|nr:disease resistance RPP13-like protein 4 [Carex littledalei]